MLKVFLVLLLAVGGSYAAFDHLKHNDISQLPKISSETQEKLAEIFSLTLLKLSAVGQTLEQHGDGMVPMFNPIGNDSIPLESVHLDIHPESEIGHLIQGQIDFCNLTLSGLSTILRGSGFSADDEGIYFNFTLTAGTLSIDGVQDLNITLFNTTQYAAITDGFFFRLNNPEVHLRITITISPTGTIILKNFALDVVLGNSSNNGIAFNFGYGVLGGEVMTDELWDNLSQLNTAIIKLALPEILRIINEILREVMADLVKDCKLQDIISGDFSCIGSKVTEKEGRLEEMLSEFVTISDSDICHGVGDWNSTTPAPTTIPGDGGTSVEPIPDHPSQEINAIFILNNVTWTNVNVSININNSTP